MANLAQRGSFTRDTTGIKAPTFDGTQPCMYVDDPDMFFPEPDEPGFYKQQKAAKAVCAECYFRLPCLEYAVDNHLLGIWGGTTMSERRKFRSMKSK